MGSNPFGIGEKESKSDGFRKTLFYFFKEFHINPFDEEFEIKNPDGKLLYTIIKRGISLPLFQMLLQELESYNIRENEAIKRASKKR